MRKMKSALMLVAVAALVVPVAFVMTACGCGSRGRVSVPGPGPSVQTISGTPSAPSLGSATVLDNALTPLAWQGMFAAANIEIPVAGVPTHNWTAAMTIEHRIPDMPGVARNIRETRNVSVTRYGMTLRVVEMTNMRATVTGAPNVNETFGTETIVSHNTETNVTSLFSRQYGGYNRCGQDGCFGDGYRMNAAGDDEERCTACTPNRGWNSTWTEGWSNPIGRVMDAVNQIFAVNWGDSATASYVTAAAQEIDGSLFYTFMGEGPGNGYDYMDFATDSDNGYRNGNGGTVTLSAGAELTLRLHMLTVSGLIVQGEGTDVINTGVSAWIALNNATAFTIPTITPAA